MCCLFGLIDYSHSRLEYGKFNAEKIYQCRYYFGYGYYPSRVRAGGSSDQDGTQEYVQSLKAVAKAYGYTPGTVDRLLGHGYSPEEIEEFFFCGEV